MANKSRLTLCSSDVRMLLCQNKETLNYQTHKNVRILFRESIKCIWDLGSDIFSGERALFYFLKLMKEIATNWKEEGCI